MLDDLRHEVILNLRDMVGVAFCDIYDSYGQVMGRNTGIDYPAIFVEVLSSDFASLLHNASFSNNCVVRIYLYTRDVTGYEEYAEEPRMVQNPTITRSIIDRLQFTFRGQYATRLQLIRVREIPGYDRGLRCTVMEFNCGYTYTPPIPQTTFISGINIQVTKSGSL